MRIKRSLLTLPILLLSLTQVVGVVNSGRSQLVVQQSRSFGVCAIEGELPEDSRGKDAFVQQLIPKLKHPNSHTRTCAALFLEGMKKTAKPAVPYLVPLLQDREPMVRRGAISALGDIGESAKSVIPKLIPLLKDSDPDVAQEAKVALKKLGYEKSK